MGKSQDLTGKRFGRLTVIALDKTVNRKGCFWKCKCDCGNETTVLASRLNIGKTKSCGCLKHDNYKDGAEYNNIKYKRLYSIWAKMRHRCEYEKDVAYESYGGRGITVCKEWHDFNSFKDWALCNGYSDDLTIDRIDNNAGYSPSNCRWADRVQQANNTRSNRLLTYNGKTMTLSEWSRELGIFKSTIYRRLDAHGDNLDLVFYKGDRRYEKRNG